MKNSFKEILGKYKGLIAGIFRQKNWLERIKVKLSDRSIYKERKNQAVIILVAIIAVALAYTYFHQPKVDRQYYKESVFCQADGDCELYDCTSCGNKFWIDKKVRNTNCEKTIPGLAGCVCQEGVCKRSYR